MKGRAAAAIFGVGVLVLVWVAAGFVGTSALALAMTALIGAVYALGAAEVWRFRAATASLGAALAQPPQPDADLQAWLDRLPAPLQAPVRQRIEGERAELPALALTPYLVGLLVMLGMLGTFLGMVVTFKGAVFALEGSADLQAIRAALAAPIRGLGLAFGTSVAGVATSALLGLMSALCRRERAQVMRDLDTLAATAFRRLSRSHQRGEAYEALQVQARALPQMVDRLQALADSLERRSQQLDAQLTGRQEQFHREVSASYTRLADTVSQSLQDSLAASARAAGESLTPVVQTAMARIAHESGQMHARMAAATEAQLGGLADAFRATAATVTGGWQLEQERQARASQALVDGLAHALQAFSAGFEQRSGALLDKLGQHWGQAQQAQTDAERQRQASLAEALARMASTLQTQWQQMGDEALARQQAVTATLEHTAAAIIERAREQALQATDGIGRLVAASEALARSRIEAEARLAQSQDERAAQTAALWRSELATLRDQEAARGQAAVERLGELQSALASHLATLGTALETPLNRLLQTASEVPRAAADVITQLRQEMGRMAERDTLALEERAVLVERIGGLLQAIEHGSGEQRRAIEDLAASAARVLEQAGSQFARSLEAQLDASRAMAAQLGGSAAGLSGLGASFQQGLAQFTGSNDRLTDSLRQIEAGLQQSLERSDEQLAYYVAQAREVIDLSITSQQGLLDGLRRLETPRRDAPAEGH